MDLAGKRKPIEKTHGYGESGRAGGWYERAGRLG